MSADLRVSLVYGVEVPRGTPAAAFAGNAAVEFVHPRGATYPVVYARDLSDSLADADVRRAVFNVTAYADRFSAEFYEEKARYIVDACCTAGLEVTVADCGWMVVCDVR